MKVGNKKEKTPCGMDLNDKDYLMTMLTIQKAMVKNYAVSLTEASNDKLNSLYLDMFNDMNKIQRDIYNLMFKKGWYQLEVATDTKKQEQIKNITQELSNLKD